MRSPCERQRMLHAPWQSRCISL